MATYYARKTGNINANDVWATTASGTAGAVTFAAGDVLIANSFTITVNVTTDLGNGEVRNDVPSGSGATAGGSFSLSNGVTLTANVIAGTATCVTTASTVSATIVGSVTGGTASSAHGVNHNSTGTLTITGNVAASSGTSARGVNNASTGTVNITGNVTAGSNAGAIGALNVVAGTTNITGTVTGGSNNVSCYGAGNTGSGTLTVTGSAIGGSLDAGVRNEANGASTVTRAIGGTTSTSAAGAANSNTGTLTITEAEWGDAGASPTSGAIRWNSSTGNVCVIFIPSAAKKTLVDVNSTSLLPAASDVRSGVSYGSGARTGTLAVPAASLVAAGTPVDNTTGTAAITSAAMQSACDAALTAFSSGRLANVATVASTGQQIADAVGA
jgi:hypothetical protein